jgi:hypothetical protein
MNEPKEYKHAIVKRANVSFGKRIFSKGNQVMRLVLVVMTRIKLSLKSSVINKLNSISAYLDCKFHIFRITKLLTGPL